MSEQGLAELLKLLRNELSSTSDKTRNIYCSVSELCKEMEALKIHAFQYYVEEQRKSIARERGMIALLHDRKKVRNSLIMAAGSFVLGGLISRDKDLALVAGIHGLDGMVKGFGESNWYILFGKKISILTQDSIPENVKPLHIDSFNEIMEKIKKKALGGMQLGNLTDVISSIDNNLQESRIKLLKAKKTNQG